MEDCVRDVPYPWSKVQFWEARIHGRQCKTMVVGMFMSGYAAVGCGCCMIPPDCSASGCCRHTCPHRCSVVMHSADLLIMVSRHTYHL